MNTRAVAWLLPCLLLAMPAYAAENNEISALKAQIKRLMERVGALERKQHARRRHE
jgi:hypothetical protein